MPMRSENFLNFSERCRRVMDVMALPEAVSSAANTIVGAVAAVVVDGRHPSPAAISLSLRPCAAPSTIRRRSASA